MRRSGYSGMSVLTGASASKEDIPKHYLSAHAPRYNRAKLDE